MAAVTQYVSMPMHRIAVLQPRARIEQHGLSRAKVKGSFGGGRSLQKSPFQSVSFSCGRPASSASSIPEVCEPKWRILICDFCGSFFHCGMYFVAGSSRRNLPVADGDSQRHAADKGLGQ